jgi:hypothetical protein
MRRIRLSTWVLTAIFLAALVAYVLLKPSSEPSGCPEQSQSPYTRSTSPAGGTLLPGAAVSPSGSADRRTRACAERRG